MSFESKAILVRILSWAFPPREAALIVCVTVNLFLELHLALLIPEQWACNITLRYTGGCIRNCCQQWETGKVGTGCPGKSLCVADTSCASCRLNAISFIHSLPRFPHLGTLMPTAHALPPLCGWYVIKLTGSALERHMLRSCFPKTCV